MIGLILSKEDIGSAHLGVIKLEANNRRQYEVSSLTNIVSYICNNATCGQVFIADNEFSKEADYADALVYRIGKESFLPDLIRPT